MEPANRRGLLRLLQAGLAIYGFFGVVFLVVVAIWAFFDLSSAWTVVKAVFLGGIVVPGLALVGVELIERRLRKGPAPGL